MLSSSMLRTKQVARLARPLSTLASRASGKVVLNTASQARHYSFNTTAAASAIVAQRVNSPYNRSQIRYYADYVVKVPHMADSISEGSLKQWNKKVGDFVNVDEEVAVIETDKVDVTVNSPKSGTIVELYSAEEDTVAVGADLYKLELGDAPAGGAAPKEEKKEAKKEEAPKKEEAAPKKEEPKQAAAPAPKAEAPKAEAPKAAAPKAAAAAAEAPSTPAAYSREERVVKMNRMRQTIAKRLKQSQEVNASLTTFNEVDMTNLMSMRSTYKDLVLKKHNVKLGFMSAFVKASCYALKEIPAVNSRVDGNEQIFSDFVDVSVAVATPKGLVTPVIRNAESMSFIDVEKAIAAYGAKARDGQIAIEDMSGGTFTISNGGVFGSLMGTPIINLPQAAILGMHAVKERAVVVNGKVEVRPMMYVALTYDHRIIDGREAVSFLVKLKEVLEDPRRLLLDV
ncbi:2-oxoglutarate dehydrogenase complex E2 component [Actinomortierella ambigua]|uniref:dihydrolipoyllysine-residue succinyltransferase n=1 Tax=Actinomortierella ambigua TaxID=1343610 RepID=A0A9P6U7R5_9FUNG|nr:2-oxoglutarate dehydrogenase complex E2 component [Actinomortierella ambigua]